MTPSHGATVRAALSAWYTHGHRDLPWRRTRDPWAIWVSEVMLQQTRAESVVPYWQKFLERFPTPAALAAAPLEDLLGLWAGLGYYARARHLHAAAVALVERHAGVVPEAPEAFAALPGVGRYTLGAVLSIAFDRPLPVLDGNVARVLSRLVALDADPRATATQKRLWDLATQLLSESAPGLHNQALMELGATVCLPRRPDCLLCPLVSVCEARRAGLEETLPRPAARAAQSRHALVSALVSVRTEDGPGVWLSQRAPDGLLGGLWELPTCEAAGPEALGALGLRVDASSEYRTIEHAFTHRKWTVRTWRGEGEPTGGGYAAHRVVPLSALTAAGLTGPALKSLHAWQVDGAPVRRGAGRKAVQTD